MRTLALAAAWTAVAALLTAGPTPAQEPGAEPVLFFSTNPGLGQDFKPTAFDTKLNLRPNLEQAVFVYVHNPDKVEQKVTVEFVSDPPAAKGKKGGAAPPLLTTEVTVGAGKSARLRLPGGVAAAPAPAPAADKGAGPPPPALTPLYQKKARFRVVRGGAEKKAAFVELPNVSNYVEVEEKGSPAGGLRLEARRLPKLDYPPAGTPVPVRLEVRREDGKATAPADLAAPGNTLRRLLPMDDPGAAEPPPPVYLSLADFSKFGPGAVAEVYVDGVRLRRRYLAGGGDAEPAVGVARPAKGYVRTGDPLPVQLLSEPGGAADPEPVEVVIADPAADGEAGADVLARRLPDLRDEGIEFRVGPAGEAVFVTRSRDWDVALPTDGLYGPRKLYARKVGDAKPLGRVRDVVFDGAAPTAPLTVKPDRAAGPVPPASRLPAAADRWYRPGQRVVLSVTPDAASGVDDDGVLFYLGAAPGPDGKDVPGGASRRGVRVDAKSRTFAAAFDLPPAPADTALAGVVVTSRAGLKNAPSVRTGDEVRLRLDPTPPEVGVVAVTEYGYAPLPPSPAPSLDPPAPYDPYAPRVRPAAPARTVEVVKPARGAGVAYRPGDRVRLTATAADRQSGLDDATKVLFFVGDPPGPDGKPVQGTVLVKEAGYLAVGPGPDGKPAYAFDYTIPKDATKDFDLKAGFWFVNRVGLAGTGVATLKVEVDTTAGTIVAKVSAGSRLKPGVPVRLIDQANSVAAEARTDDCGVARFEKLLPGRYAIQAYDPADGNAQDTVIAAVRGGETKEVALSLKRSP